MPFGQPKENLTRWYRWRGKFWRHDWARVADRLGIWPDYLLAHELGCKPSTVSRMRRRLGISPACGPQAALRRRVRERERLLALRDSLA